MSSSQGLRTQRDELDGLLDVAKRTVDGLSDSLDTLAYEDLHGDYDATRDALLVARDELDKLERQRRGLDKAIGDAEAGERERARAEAQATVERVRAEAAMACRAWDGALEDLERAYGQLRDLHMQAAASARLLGMTHGAFSIEGYAYLSGLRAATSEFPGGSPILGGLMAGRPLDARPLANKLGLPEE